MVGEVDGDRQGDESADLESVSECWDIFELEVARGKRCARRPGRWPRAERGERGELREGRKERGCLPRLCPKVVGRESGGMSGAVEEVRRGVRSIAAFRACIRVDTADFELVRHKFGAVAGTKLGEGSSDGAREGLFVGVDERRKGV